MLMRLFEPHILAANEQPQLSLVTLGSRQNPLEQRQRVLGCEEGL